jgi:DNA-binding CsgD family transcriptional regulator/tetratricopeptide (TPR) repeat protein
VPAVRCPVLIGRRTELATLRAGLAGARLGHGGLYALVGPPGIGKSRLAREAAGAARTWDIPVLVGRAVESGAGTAFRPLTEALLGGLRHVTEPAGPALTPFRSALGRIVPHWRTTAPVDDSLVVLGEATLRLLAALAGDRGLLLILEDLHWSDPETLAVLEYLADNVADERVVLLVTARDDPGSTAVGLLRTLAERQAGVLVQLGMLTADEVDAMAAACLDEDLTEDVRATLHRRTAGTPLFVEELLAAGIDPAVVVPTTVAGLVAGRLDALDPPARDCVRAAAVLGERFDWRILDAVLARPGGLADMLRAATESGLVDPSGSDGFRFHHVLSRDAVLATVLPPERAQWARRGLAAVVAAHPELDGPWCDVAADLALQAGDTARAAEVLVEAGRRNLAGGALTSAETVLERARLLVGDGSPLAADADDALAEVLAQAGKTDAAVAAATRMISRLRHVRGSERDLAEAHLRLARVHATAGDWRSAEAELAAARSSADDDQRLRIAAVSARVALGDSRLDDARRSAEEAAHGTPDVAVEALVVLGRIARRHDLAAAEALFERACEIADRAGLVVAATRAIDEIAIGDVQESLRVDRLDEARSRAAALGDVAAVAVLDLQTIATCNSRWEPDLALAAAERCIAASRRFRLPTLSKALVLGAAAHDQLGRSDEAEIACAEALRLEPDDTHLFGEVWGLRAYRALQIADDTSALAHLDRAMEAFAIRPNEVTGSPAVGFWVLMRAITDADRHDPPATPDPVNNRWNRGLVGFAAAVSRGRRGDRAGAEAAFTTADTLLRRPVDAAWSRLLARRPVAAAALRDGWGDPGGWAAEDLPVLEARGLDRWAAALRGVWRRSGAVVPRRGRGDAAVPAELRALGVSSRETDVLVLVAEGRSNRDVAERLYLSPRTVEKHVERLLAKTGLQRRAELVAYAAHVLGMRVIDPRSR